MWKLWSLLLLILVALPLTAQEDDDPPNVLVYGDIVTGRIDNRTASVVYTFEGLRGDYVAIRLRTTSGNLDPVLSVVDADGRTLVFRDDTRGSLEAYEDSLLIEQTGQYTVVVARFGYGLGTTIGEYELTIDRIGNSSASGTSLRYGDTVLNTISDEIPEYFYSFRANEGDIINLSMRGSSGDLDPYLQVVHIVNGQTLVLQESDDTADSLDAFIEELVIPATATYYIVATRFGAEAGPSSGNFLLTIEEAANSGLANTAQTAARLRLNGSTENEITADNFERFYRIQAQQNDIITVSMEQITGTLDTYLILTNAGLQPLIEDDDGGIGRNSLIEDFVIPASGTYYIIATRYEFESGTSTGRFRLSVEQAGNVFADVPPNVQRMDYNLSITGSLDEVTPDETYVFYGEAGDVVTLTMNRDSGDFTPVLTLLNANQRELTRASGRTARLERFELPESGVYYIRTERAAPETTGNYVLVLALVARPEPTPTPDGG